MIHAGGYRGRSPGKDHVTSLRLRVDSVSPGKFYSMLIVAHSSSSLKDYYSVTQI